ncbi:TIGR00730 family Rossman fold protein [Arsenophonus nasoniae]|uniref:Cytokinin riboside 5'-monophosphate phosphoribohydrolase n=1 Tax=Arsenophonus nasoniae TaxID=638 RepID=D2TYA6_9GAMM|nr:TIGR00730 family Rossman fold protein [Arsenophonus nasoniae]QBY43023.1 LOG family protein YvdD [Arsenophonus nasoniae]WGM02785.1 TIGR00730 family Rossman fold protein [Arsenophonus nasoniae]WGM07059.1 TIGR00730 family Rossman fold protein [Arsenophonus nasoniae]WGM11939.1 TIGR00730 family Rossman fold protein [Arsenophonus nasoniae]WGM16623.1 TIGR00730 family Rossman fold protein [Arsenophonus nasoniae]
MGKIKSVTVYCGSSVGASGIYQQQAVALASELVNRKITLVYGGGRVGIMGVLANSILEQGGQVIGVMPKLLVEREISHTGLTKSYIVDTMHQRKQKMIDLADGFIALPGGFGTLEEFSEVFTWGQIGLHAKPCGLLNVNNYWTPLVAMIEKMADEKFLQEKYRHMAIVDDNPANLLDRFLHYTAPSVKTYDEL